MDRFAPLLHGTARAWRLKLDRRLKPLGLTQAKWRTLLHLSTADRPITQAEIAAHLGIEEPTLVTLLHRLERGGWVARKNAPHDRRCKTVHLGKRASRVIHEISATAAKLRRELLSDISAAELKICMRVLQRVHEKAQQESTNGRRNGRRSTSVRSTTTRQRNGKH